LIDSNKHFREPVFFSNRALVYLKLNRFYEAITDCTASLDRKQSIKVNEEELTLIIRLLPEEQLPGHHWKNTSLQQKIIRKR